MSVPTGPKSFTETARVQHGLITLAQTGLSSSAMSKAVRRGEYDRVLPGVFRTMLAVITKQQAALAAVLWAGEGAVASHLTAAGLHGFDIPHRAVHVWIPTNRSRRSQFVVVHRGVVAPNDRRLRDHVPATSPARTLVDLAGILDVEQLESATENFLHRGLTTPQSIIRCLDAIGGTGRAGSGRLRRILADRDDAALESKLEVKVWRLLRGAGLRPVRQYEVRIGQRRYRLDFAWPVLKVAVEAEGFGVHGRRRAFVSDRRRLAELVAAGWSVIPVTWDDCIDAPGDVVARVSSALMQVA